MDNALTDLNQGHTPGPWAAGETRYQRDMRTFQNVMAGEYNFVAAVSSDPQNREATGANARLIAASPDLLKALQDLVAAVETGPWVKEQQAPLDAALNAIARATGAA